MFDRSPLDLPIDRRQVLTGASALAGLFGLRRTPIGVLFDPVGAPLTFTPIAASTEDTVRVPEGYEARVFYPWGTPVRPGAPAWRLDGNSNDQRLQAGTHHDGMAYFPIDALWDDAKNQLVGSSTHGYLAINHEYTDEGLLHADGTNGWSAEKVRKSKAALGVSLLEIEHVGGEWRVRDGRRVTGLDECEMRGPARGHALLQTVDPFDQPWERDGTGAEGTFANCANGKTPWGTYLTCEENFQDYFARTKLSAEAIEASTPAEGIAAAKLTEQRCVRYGIGDPFLADKSWRSVSGWDQHDDRFDADRPARKNHCHRFGWVVEIDPRDPTRKPAKRTALGRCRHENAAVALAPDGRVVVYTGDDERFEYVYKFVSKGKFEPELAGDDEVTRRRKREHNWTLLDEGTLYVARFDAGDSGRWLELSLANELIARSGEFRDLGEVLIFARRAADLAGATKMDRPEWIAVDQEPASKVVRNVYVSLSNNSSRGAANREGATPPNPRTENIYGHILRWCETDGDPAAMTFRWSIFVLAGSRDHTKPEHKGTIKDVPGAGSPQDFGSPDGLTMDPRGGVLWVQTDVAMTMQGRKEHYRLGNNQMLAIDVATAEVRRFLTGPRGCEITGLAFTPDCKTMFVNVQHPGEGGDGFGDPAQPLAVSAWPNGATDQRPRSATVIVTRKDGGEIGR